MRFSIPDADLEVTTFRGRGPGGQHRNVTESAVRVRHIPTGIVVVATASRSQRKNKEAALEELRRRIEARRRRPKSRVATKPSRAARAHRLQAKKAQSAKKRLRQRPREDD